MSEKSRNSSLSALVISTVASSITMMMLGFLLYGVLFASLFKEGAIVLPGVMRATPQILWIVVGQVGFGVLVSLVVSWRGALSFLGGAWTGVVFGFLMATGVDFAQYGTSNLWTMKATLLDPLITAALVGAGGGVSGLVLGRFRAP
ncbi:MAG: hypothetical protein AB8B96_13610 [Lysobacterales bacterium]